MIKKVGCNKKFVLMLFEQHKLWLINHLDTIFRKEFFVRKNGCSMRSRVMLLRHQSDRHLQPILIGATSLTAQTNGLVGENSTLVVVLFQNS
jgi:hypothetical protein